MKRSAFLCKLCNCLLATALLLLLQIALPSQTRTAAAGLYKFRPGVHISTQYPLTNQQLQTLLEKLRFCTGFRATKFDEKGRLDLGDRSLVTGGSAKARQLIIAAVDSSDSFILENRNHSPLVVFTEIADTGDFVDEAGDQHSEWQIRIDFFDFTTLRGGRLSLAAFDPAMNLLHELIHGVLKLRDPAKNADPLGDCERHLNLIRAELGLPERRTYLPRLRLVSPVVSNPQVVQAEFIFVHKNPQTGRQTDLYLTFDLGTVSDLGGLKRK